MRNALLTGAAVAGAGAITGRVNGEGARSSGETLPCAHLGVNLGGEAVGRWACDVELAST